VNELRESFWYCNNQYVRHSSSFHVFSYSGDKKHFRDLDLGDRLVVTEYSSRHNFFGCRLGIYKVAEVSITPTRGVKSLFLVYMGLEPLAEFPSNPTDVENEWYQFFEFSPIER
jgi:hypothetical protein